jgi:hypothetical protein
MVADACKEHLERHAVVQILAARGDLVAGVDAGPCEGVEDRLPALASSSNAVSTEAAGRCGQG